MRDAIGRTLLPEPNDCHKCGTTSRPLVLAILEYEYEPQWYCWQCLIRAFT